MLLDAHAQVSSASMDHASPYKAAHLCREKRAHLFSSPSLLSVPCLLEPCLAPVTLACQDVSLQMGLSHVQESPLSLYHHCQFALHHVTPGYFKVVKGSSPAKSLGQPTCCEASAERLAARAVWMALRAAAAVSASCAVAAA